MSEDMIYCCGEKMIEQDKALYALSPNNLKFKCSVCGKEHLIKDRKQRLI